MRSGYVNLKTDWGFKHLMGEEAQMRSFLNSLLSEEYGEIKSVTFENVEVLSGRKGGRGVIFDLCCTTDSVYCKKRSAKKYSHSSLPTGVLQ